MAAIFGQIGDQIVHRRKVGRVIDVATFLPRGDQAGAGELGDVKGERRRGQPQCPGYGTGIEPILPGLDEQAEDRQACLLRG